MSDDLALRIVLGATPADLPERFELRPGITVVDVAKHLAAIGADLYGADENGQPDGCPQNPERGWRNVRDTARVIAETHADTLPDAGLFADLRSAA
ncbi:MAG: hypothetical protein CMM84_03830 [Rhodothermaceae bacterium]|nr:hypothetical protein [Rhodothermaceae bacterium]MBC15347.1 hypothetical protein [Rhodothermaceae bacterium]